MKFDMILAFIKHVKKDIVQLRHEPSSATTYTPDSFFNNPKGQAIVSAFKDAQSFKREFSAKSVTQETLQPVSG